MSTPFPPTPEHLTAMSDEVLSLHVASLQERATLLGARVTELGLDWVGSPLVEGLRGQVVHSRAGYTESSAFLLDGLDIKQSKRPTSPDQRTFDDRLTSQFRAWSEKGPDGKNVFDFIREQKELHPAIDWTLVAEPVLPESSRGKRAPHQAIQAAFKVFARTMPNNNTDWIYDSYCQDYTADQIMGAANWSGNQLSIHFELVPTTFTEEVPSATVADQKTKLAAFQNNNPSARLHISSPLAQLSRLAALRSQHGAAALANFDLTFTRNIDLPVLGGCVPCSYVLDGGDVVADRDAADVQCGSRVAAG